MKETVKKMIHGRMEQAFQKFLWKNEDYLKSRAEYHALFGILKEKLRGSREDEEFLMKFDELIGAYTEKYEEAVYMMGFHDGMEMEAEHAKYKVRDTGRERTDLFTEQDMVHLIFLYDAFRDLCIFISSRILFFACSTIFLTSAPSTSNISAFISSVSGIPKQFSANVRIYS